MGSKAIHGKSGFLIGGTSSGSGKTTLSLGIMAALKRRGYDVAPFKVGPDYIDPGHHRRVTGRASRNLDGWMLSRDYCRDAFSRTMAQADLAVVEGVMGLFDGFSGTDEAGSSAQMAKWLGLPVILVVNAASMARSAAALVTGFENFDPELNFLGVVFNNIGSKSHLTYLTEALSVHSDMPCLGGIPRDEALRIPERHLGLVTDEEHVLSGTETDHLADTVEAHIDLDLLLERAGELSLSQEESKGITPESAQPVKIGVAMDSAFCFYYPDNLETLEKAGATLDFFSPAEDETLPEGISGIYFGGGYPELFAEALSGNTAMRRAVKAAADAGMPVYGECGGLMYLSEAITDFEGRRWEMTGCLPLETRMQEKRCALGYREITLKETSLLGPSGTTVRGHEFHYSKPVGEPKADRIYRVTPRTHRTLPDEGYVKGNTLGSYVHLHFGSSAGVGEAFVARCNAYKESTTR
ncbi:cobyrinate a,c-diamide synthase [Desulfoluna butyratoxydans]|uniref:Cobyrinate a,c-diamide synthase n=1 Tax=Desulfoluna butyratoxydans TaxID=231438 RepID=A0A4U8YZJ8_9BACT|nr:cobyrinate a,c-diamide synthase [Desulfoluna butyratoxydans]VFQ47243.1 cobyrinic acid a c-diamide synthase cbia [Desulfoluna butyratoxydans]